MKKNVLGMVAAAGVVTTTGLSIFQYCNYKKMEKLQKNIARLNAYYVVLNQWLEMKIYNNSILDFFNTRNIQNIAIYGMGELGIHLYNELAGTNVIVKYCIDQVTKDKDSSLYRILTIDELETAEKVDAIIVTPMSQFHEIHPKLIKYNDTIISLWSVFHA